MSVAKVHVVNRAQKDQGECEKCHRPVQKGQSYRWFIVGFRSKHKHVRCMESTCTPKRSERESSKMSAVYEAIESAETQINDAMNTAAEALDPDDYINALTEVASEVAEAVREVAQEYRDAAEAFEHGNAQHEERADELDSAADTLDSWAPSENAPERCDEHGPDETDSKECPDCRDLFNEWAENMATEALDAIGEVDV